MEQLDGYVEHIIFRNEENGYTVFVLISGQEEMTCVGMFPSLNEGEHLLLSGQFVSHTTYGDQFRVSAYEVRHPEGEEAIERYLGSGAIKGIGAALAARIVRKFHQDTFRILEEEPERLAEVKGISEKKARELAERVLEKKDMREAMMFLQQFGISTALSVKIYQKYAGNLYEIIQKNPYQLADDIEGVGFKIADEIARRAGIAPDSEFRIKSAMLYVLSQAYGEGHVYLPEQELLDRSQSLLQLELMQSDQYLLDLVMDRRIYIREEEEIRKVYSYYAYHVELNTARMLMELNITGQIDPQQIREKISRLEQKTGTVLDEKQRQAVMEAIRCGLLIITGGPGTGKTTTINMLIAYFASEGLEIQLAAPTGRAAKRMTEATGYEAKTLHRLLEISAGSENRNTGFARNEENPLEGDVIIVDEMSMVDLFLMHALLKAVVTGTRLIMVGDENQLPSVGPGCVLKDMIASGRIPVVCLTTIFRQAAQSDIVLNAHRINHGEVFVPDNQSRDFFFLRRQDSNTIISIVIQLLRDKIPRYVNAQMQEIQVLCPMKKGTVGVERMNRILQEYLNPPSRDKTETVLGEVVFRQGDKVMQIRNNYQLEWEILGRYGVVAETGTGIFNGDVGVIREIHTEERELIVEFDEHRMVHYPYSGLDELELAYAVTIHKSQGSEYPAVIIPLLSGPRMLMNRNLLYTAVTRAKSCVILVGEEKEFCQMIQNAQEQKRYSSLAGRIVEAEE